ncbi:MAG: sugar ABC transporter permease [Ruminococcaceae bacterium]|nr:sugar ABC transporter permease [Oscillospiraceae bacterium]
MKKNKLLIFLFMLPCVLTLLVMYVYPVCRTVLMSLFRVESLTAGTSEWTFYGLSNYTTIISNNTFQMAMKNMLLIWVAGGVITLALAMVMAVVLTSGIRGAKFFRAAIYLPNIISAVALATMWVQYIFNYDYGLLNELLELFGLEGFKWLGSDSKFWAMTASFIFGSVGYYMLIYISGIEGIPKELYEASMLDGAGKITQFRTITMPLLKRIIKTSITFWSINATTFFLWSKMFSPIQTEESTVVPVIYLYDIVFGGKGIIQRDAGAGAAVGVVLTIVIVAIYGVMNLLVKDTDMEY